MQNPYVIPIYIYIYMYIYVYIKAVKIVCKRTPCIPKGEHYLNKKKI